MILLRELFFYKKMECFQLFNCYYRRLGLTGLQDLRIESIKVRQHSCSVCLEDASLRFSARNMFFYATLMLSEVK